MGRPLIALGATALILLAACGDDGDGGTSSPPGDTATTAAATTDTVAVTDGVATTDSSATTDAAVTTQPTGVGLPAECVAPPVAVTAQRVGSSPLGSDVFGLIDAVAIPVPIVPNPDRALGADETKTLAATTDLLGYSLVFADEEITGPGSMFFQFEPSTADKLRGLVSIFPATGVPLAAGDVVVYGQASGLSIPLPTIGMDLVAFDQSTNTYRNEPTGQVAVLGITDDALCLDVDLTWKVNKPADNVLTIQGVFVGRLLDRSIVVILG